MIARRLMPLIVAFVLAFAPVALEACQAVCLSRQLETSSPASGHHHHSHGAPATSTSADPAHHQTATSQTQASRTAIAGQHLCDHGEELPALDAGLNSLLASPAVVVSSVDRPDKLAPARHARDTIAAPASQLTTLTTQLRV
jgi:hypothetical protein